MPRSGQKVTETKMPPTNEAEVKGLVVSEHLNQPLLHIVARSKPGQNVTGTEAGDVLIGTGVVTMDGSEGGSGVGLKVNNLTAKQGLFVGVNLTHEENLRFQPLPKNGAQEQLLVEETEELAQLERMEMLC